MSQTREKRPLSKRLRKLRRRAEDVGRALSAWPKAVDRAIYCFFPKWGARRLATRRLYEAAEVRHKAMSRAFHAAESDRLSADKWLTSRLSPDSALETDLDEMRSRCESLYRNDTIGHSAVEGRVANEVGTGILPQARIREKETPRAGEINERLEDVARRWSENGVDRSQRESLCQIEKLVCRTFAITGEAFIALADVGRADKPIPLTLDVIDPSRIETPPGKFSDKRVRMGIEHDDAGRVVAYWVLRSHPGDTKASDLDYDRIPAWDSSGQPRMLHVFDQMLPGQSRGIPWMAAALNRIKDASDILEYEIIAKQIEACFAAFVKTEDETSPLDIATGAQTDSESGRRIEEFRPGMIEYLRKNEEITFGDANRPGATFFPLIEFALRQIAAALNYPYELLAKNFFRTTYSSGRLALLDGRVGFKMRRQVMVEKLLIPVWKRIVFEAALVGELDGLVDPADYARRPHIYQRHIWQAPGWQYVDPEKETRATVIGVRNDVETLADALGERGKDWEEHLAQRQRERERQVESEVAVEALRRDLRRAAGLDVEEEAEEDETLGQEQVAVEGAA